MLMVKKKQNTPNRQIMTVLKKFWWVVLLLVAIGVWIVYISLNVFILQRRFESTYSQARALYQSINVRLENKEENDSSITKLCRRIGSEFEPEIECGVYVNEITLGIKPEDLPKVLDDSLKRTDFESIELSTGDDKNDGAGVFLSKSGIKCFAYWNANDDELHTTLNYYCRDIVPDYLPGYSR